MTRKNREWYRTFFIWSLIMIMAECQRVQFCYLLSVSAETMLLFFTPTRRWRSLPVIICIEGVHCTLLPEVFSFTSIPSQRCGLTSWSPVVPGAGCNTYRIPSQRIRRFRAQHVKQTYKMVFKGIAFVGLSVGALAYSVFAIPIFFFLQIYWYG